MPATERLRTTTDFSIYKPYIDILTYYDDGTGRFIFFWISQATTSMENVDMKEGDLVAKYLVTSAGPEDFYINNSGELIADSERAEAMYIERETGILYQNIE